MRHPLAFLVEAADDISYRVIDIEDGYRLGHIDLRSVMELFGEIIKDPGQKARLGRIRDDKGKVEFMRHKQQKRLLSVVRVYGVNIQTSKLI